MKRKKYTRKAPLITTGIGIILIGISYFIDKTMTSGFIYNINSDTYGVGLALAVGGFIWLVKNYIKE